MPTRSEHGRAERLKQMAHRAGHITTRLYDPGDPGRVRPGLYSLVSSDFTSVFWHEPGKSKCVATLDDIEAWLTEHPDGKGDTPKMKEDRRRGAERRTQSFRASVKDWPKPDAKETAEG